MICPTCRQRTVSEEARAACARACLSPRCPGCLTEFFVHHRVSLAALVALVAEKVEEELRAEPEEAFRPERKSWTLPVLGPPVRMEMMEA